MSEAPERLHRVEGQGRDTNSIDLLDYCARPLCRKEFRQSTGRGRRRDYCSETCRRIADREYKQAKAMVEHFERLSERSRYDVRAFGRAADDLDTSTDIPVDVARERANAGIARARAVLQFADGADPRLIAELRQLCDALEPAVRLIG